MEDLSQPTKALIDTGSERCLFPRGIGDALNVEFASHVPREVVGIGGADREVVMTNVVLSVTRAPEMWWHAPVGFFVDEWDITFGILGNRGFLDRCVVSFHRSANYFVLESVEEWERRTPPDPFEEFQKLDVDWDRPGD